MFTQEREARETRVWTQAPQEPGSEALKKCLEVWPPASGHSHSFQKYRRICHHASNPTPLRCCCSECSPRPSASLSSPIPSSCPLLVPQKVLVNIDLSHPDAADRSELQRASDVHLKTARPKSFRTSTWLIGPRFSARWNMCRPPYYCSTLR